jgi:hypothetical protein
MGGEPKCSDDQRAFKAAVRWRDRVVLPAIRLVIEYLQRDRGKGVVNLPEPGMPPMTITVEKMVLDP